ncbi:MAG: gas vesicle protein [Chloroflexi bacterium]|nr:gas vesicle protein [Chloroflexota bacterium]
MSSTPLPAPSASLVDLLDRLLDRGLVVNADVVISLADVPLIGLNLRAALAGIETMLSYGVMAQPGEEGAARGLETPHPQAGTPSG